MKITQYFTSPIKELDRKSIGNQEISKESVNENVNIESKNEIQNNNKETTKSKSKKPKKKKRRIPSDPIVKDVTALFSNNCTLISPNTILSDKSLVSDLQHDGNVKQNSEYYSPNSSKKLLSEDQEQRDNGENQSPKSESNINAFQFLMNNRNSIIGQNSCGKIAPEQQSSPNDQKQKLASRKKLFQNWADQKGATKRKRLQDEIDCCINIKMEKRSRRFKAMLQNSIKDNIVENDLIEVQKKRVRKNFSSESESSNDTTRLVNSCMPKLVACKLKDINEEIAVGNVKIETNKKEQNSLLNFVGVSKDKDNNIEVFDENSETECLPQKKVIKVKMFTPESTKKRTSLLSLKRDKVDHKKIIMKSDLPVMKNENLSCKDKVNIDNMKNDFQAHISPESNENNGHMHLLYPSCSNIQPPRRSLRPNRKISTYSEFAVDLDSTKSKKVKPSNREKLTNKNLVISHDGERTTKLAAIFQPGNSLPKKILKANRKKRKSSLEKEEHKSENVTTCKSEIIPEITLSSDSDSESTVKKNPIKVAPLFLKVGSKSKFDKENKEARKRFLMSGIPESLKKTVEKQISIENWDYNIFPAKSHIQQKCDNPLWNLSEPDLSLLEVSLFDNTLYNMDCQNLIVKTIPSKLNFVMTIEKLRNLKFHLNKIKTENPNYPVYKVFQHIYRKSGRPLKKNAARKSPKKKPKKEIKQTTKDQVDHDELVKDFELWTEKYKPEVSEQILGNHKVVSSLKKWLGTWMNYSQEINASKRKREDENSESDFELTDYDSRDSMRLLGNTMILIGPCGSGKTTSVYTIANELGFNVLEVNASSKRTGKKIIQELQEATQSHQVRKKGTNTSLRSDNCNEANNRKDKQDTKKMCILFVEDIDLVFDQDDGFLNSLSQLIMTSKRPIILTTTDSSSSHVQKLINQHECLTFRPIYKEVLGVWLQIVCLAEGLLVDKNDIGNLLNYNRGDIRKTLLWVQYWCQSGGQLNRDDPYSLNITPPVSDQCSLDIFDEDLKVPLENNIAHHSFVHRQCLGSFEVFRINKQFRIPYWFDLGKIWWNISYILNLPICSERLSRNEPLAEGSNNETQTDDSTIMSSKIASLSKVYDSLVLADELYKAAKWDSEEPIVNAWSTTIKDSLELTDRKEDILECVDLTYDVIHTLVNEHIEEYQNMYSINSCVDLAVPNSLERRWRSKQHMSENFLKQPVAATSLLERASVALDYLPTLRQIARSEDKRAASNTKRGNRFRHYFKYLNMDFNENKSKSCCNVLYLSNMDVL